ncbi:uncharacterized protein CC84DRAFT_1160087 [Paraphaeosphaeria sporulosa]|uniref:Secreted protein n=1 Tax=Paraphaeosphaeria sporulosa TaxID=1460663 RepID=A0A177D1C4_9PLEO|nr:uncharacterized protein CC84DRAFT_1160087 [Paraphaeosphaeria sporulosa]OAG12829.1 hypothetical protein CC84DRAFT_1160087 [Paraphaeosphaeria sporulosa]
MSTKPMRHTLLIHFLALAFMRLLPNITTTGREVWPYLSFHTCLGLVLHAPLLPNTAASPSVPRSVTLVMDRFGHNSTAW